MDDDWVSFLRNFNKPMPTTDAQDEEEEDEEYVFQVRSSCGWVWVGWGAVAGFES